MKLAATINKSGSILAGKMALASCTATEKVAAHNVSRSAHPDLREQIVAVQSVVDTIAAVQSSNDIVSAASGCVASVNDASERKLVGLYLYGKTTQNGTPTPENPVELVSAGAGGAIKTTVVGKNLYDMGKYALTQGCWITSTGSFSQNSVYAATLDYIPVNYLAGKTITLNKRPGGQNPAVAFYDADKVVSSYVHNKQGSAGTPWVIDVPEDAVYMRFTTIAGDEEIQIEFGDTATAYESYKAQTITAATPNGLPGIPVSSGGNYTDENGQQWISDEIDFARGVYVQRVYTEILTCDYTPADIGATLRFWCATDYQSCSAESGFCTHLPWIASYELDTEHCYAHTGTPRVYVYIRKDRFSGTDRPSVQAYLEANPMKVTYALATPIEIALSVEELAQYAALHSNKPNTTVCNDAGAGLAVEYAADTKNYIDNKFTELRSAILSAGANI